MRFTRCCAAAAVGLTVGAGATAAQAAASLTKPDAKYPEPLTRISGVRELSGNKVLVSDMVDKLVLLIDLGSGTATKVGRQGQGPGEFGLPGALLSIPKGETLLLDLVGRRFLVIGADGKPGGTVNMPSSGAPGLGSMGPDTKSDNLGRIYFAGPGFNFNGGTAPDSVPIQRWDRTGPKFDTVAWVSVPKADVTSSGGSGGYQRFSVRIGGSKIFTAEEQWAVSGDGRIVRVRPNPYQVTWYDGPSKATPGPVVPYTPLKVTEADKQQFIEQQKRQKPMMVTIGGPGGGGGRAPNFTQPPPEFADTKPPFTGGFGGGSVFATPEGEVWVARTRSASEKTPVYDVFDRSGKLVRKVSLNPDSRIIGFGAGTVYVVRTDEDDLQYLEKYRK